MSLFACVGYERNRPSVDPQMPHFSEMGSGFGVSPSHYWIRLRCPHIAHSTFQTKETTVDKRTVDLGQKSNLLAELCLL